MRLASIISLLGTTLVACGSYLFIPHPFTIPILDLHDTPKLIVVGLGAAWSLLGTVQGFRLGKGIFPKLMLLLLFLPTMTLACVMPWWVLDYSYRLPEPTTEAVGTSAENFTLKDQRGDDVSLADYRDKRVVLYFYRGGWCPFCVHELRLLAEFQKEIESDGGVVIALSGEPQTDVAVTSERHGIEFPLLADPDSKVIREWGVVHEDAVPGKTTARPALFFLAPGLRVVETRQPDNYRFTFTLDELRAAFAKTALEPTKIGG